MSLESANSTSIGVQTCAACGAELAPTLLSCPSCRRLVHTDRLNALAEAAESALVDDNPSLALASWQEAITLLPRGTRQYAMIAERIARLGRQVESSPVRSPAARPASDAPAIAPGAGQSASGWSKGAASGVAGTLALAAWKFKFLAFMVLSKGKLLLLGLTKGQHVSVDVRHGRGLLDGVWVLVCAGAGGVDLHP